MVESPALRHPLSQKHIEAALLQRHRHAEYDRLTQLGDEDEALDDLDHEIAGAVFLVKNGGDGDLRAFAAAYDGVDPDTLPEQERMILEGVTQLVD